MTWTNFLLILLVMYLAYYGLNVIFDLFMSRKKPAYESGNDVLFFNEDVSPELITYEEGSEAQAALPALVNQEPKVTKQPNFTSGLLTTTGSVGIKELFNLAKNDLIEFTKAIPY